MRLLQHEFDGEEHPACHRLLILLCRQERPLTDRLDRCSIQDLITRGAIDGEVAHATISLDQGPKVDRPLVTLLSRTRGILRRRIRTIIGSSESAPCGAAFSPAPAPSDARLSRTDRPRRSDGNGDL